MNHSPSQIIKAKERCKAELKEYLDNLTFPEFDFSSDDPAVVDPIVDAAGDFAEKTYQNIEERLGAISPASTGELYESLTAIAAAVTETVGGKDVAKAYQDFVDAVQGVKSKLESMDVDDSYTEYIPEEYLEEGASEE